MMSVVRTPQARKLQHGFTLIEILIAVVVVGLVLTAIMSALTVSVKNAAESRYRGRATTLAQQGMEFFSREKTLLGWGEFMAVFPTGTTTYCIPTLPAAKQLSTLASGSCTTANSNTIQEAGVVYRREVVVTKSSASAPELSVDVRVLWTDASRTPEVVLTRIFRKTD